MYTSKLIAHVTILLNSGISDVTAIVGLKYLSYSPFTLAEPGNPPGPIYISDPVVRSGYWMPVSGHVEVVVVSTAWKSRFCTGPSTWLKYQTSLSTP